MRRKTLKNMVCAFLIVGLVLLPVPHGFCAGERRPYIPGSEAPRVAVSFGAGHASTLAAEEAYVTHYLLQRTHGALRTGLSQLKGDVFEAIWQYRNNVRIGSAEYLPTRSTVSSQNDMITFQKGGGFGPAVQLKSGSPSYIVKEMLQRDTRAERFIVPDDQYDDVVAALRSKAARGEISQARLAREIARLEKGGITNRQPAFAGVIAASLMGAANALTQWARTGEVDWAESATFAGVGGVGAFGGTWVGAQTQWVLMTKPARNLMNAALGSKVMLTVSRLGGFAAATLVTSALITYGLYFAGQISLKEANRTMVATGVGTGVALAITGGAVWIVGTFGTASTGTAISTLSGAASSNAILAWFGGGSVAAGGGGVSLGAAVLTGGFVIIVLGGTLAVLYYYKWKDARENRERIAFLLDEASRYASAAAGAR